MNGSVTESGTTLRHAREFLLHHGEMPPGLLAQDAIVRSWKRSLGAGLHPAILPEEAPHLSAGELAQARDRHAELRAHAQPVMHYVLERLRGSDSMVIVSDLDGLILDAQGDAGFVGRAQRVSLAPGATWNERHRGTNAIGTALAESKASVVHGEEHFLDQNTFLSCSAAPIHGPDGRLRGVLDISGDQHRRHPHTLALAQMGAHMVENRLFDATHRGELRLRLHACAEGIGSLAEGLLAVSGDDRIVGANAAAMALLGLRAADLGRVALAKVLEVSAAELRVAALRRAGEAMPVRRTGGGPLFLAADLLPARHCSQARGGRGQGDALAALDTGDERVRAAICRASRVLGKDIPLLVQGESGAGKEVFAKAVHCSGPRRGQAFVPVNCAALPENLIEAELFGYVPGAFTGARREGAPGRIREAHGGTLFLDEIGDMPLTLQARLLRVLQERKVVPLGCGRPVDVDFHLICATHRDLRAEVAAGRFRTDLYYRLNGLTVTLPPLRERRDFDALLARLLDEVAEGRPVRLKPAVARAFAHYAWPGNLRQLANALRTACALLEPGETCIGWDHLPEELAAEVPGAPEEVPLPAAPENLRLASDAVILRTLEAAGGNVSEAARRLGISRNTLYRRLRALRDETGGTTH